MKIYFTASTIEFLKYKKNYLAIRNFLIQEKHVLTRDWIPHTKELIETGERSFRDIKQVYQACMAAINEADLVIIEDTVSNFSTGHQITVALQRQKPTLVLWAKRKHRYFNNTFIQGLDSDLLECYDYTLENYREIVKQFINKYENANIRNRFHLVLNEVERKYLDWAQFKKEKSRTKIIRDSLRKSIDEDEDYRKYLAQ